jgi:hypothetical protein
VSWTWEGIILGIAVAFVLLLFVLAALERDEDEKEPHREEGDER